MSSLYPPKPAIVAQDQAKDFSAYALTNPRYPRPIHRVNRRLKWLGRGGTCV